MLKKTLILLTFVSLSICAQEKGKPNFEFGALWGVTFENIERIGGAVFIEGRYNIIPNLKLKLSLGYSNLMEGKDLAVKTYNRTATPSGDKFQALSYTIEKYNYEMIPVSAGLEYSLGSGAFIPYLNMEIGFNSFSVKIITGKKYYGAGGTVDSFTQLPVEYQLPPPGFFTGDSYKIAFGAGARFTIPSFVTADIRYCYQINTSLINGHLFLIGFTL